MGETPQHRRALQHTSDQELPAEGNSQTLPPILPTGLSETTGLDEWAAVRQRVRTVDDAFRLLSQQPEERLPLHSTLTFHLKGTAVPTSKIPDEPEPVAMRFWNDSECMKDFHIRGTLICVRKASDPDRTEQLLAYWREWLATAGRLLDFVETPTGCTEARMLRHIPDVENRWLYLLHDFVKAPVFTWDLSDSQIAAWWQGCEKLGVGKTYYKSGGQVLRGAAPGKRLSLDGLCSIKRLPESFHVCSEVRDVIYESERLLACLKSSPTEAGVDRVEPDATVESDTHTEPDARGYVRHPIDQSPYVSASKILAEHCPNGFVLTHKQLVSALEQFQVNRVKWSRPIGKNGEPRQNRRTVHLTDWLEYVRRSMETESDGTPHVSPEEKEKRQAAIRARKKSGK